MMSPTLSVSSISSSTSRSTSPIHCSKTPGLPYLRTRHVRSLVSAMRYGAAEPLLRGGASLLATQCTRTDMRGWIYGFKLRSGISRPVATSMWPWFARSERVRLSLGLAISRASVRARSVRPGMRALAGCSPWPAGRLAVLGGRRRAERRVEDAVQRQLLRACEACTRQRIAWAQRPKA